MSLSPEISIPLPDGLVTARLEERPNRFIVHARIAGGEVVRAHLPDPGRLRDLLPPGATLRLQHRPEPGRRTAWTALLVEAGDGELVCLDTTAPNRLAEAALRAGALEELDGWIYERREVRHGASRFDFRLRNPAGRPLLLEVKGVSLLEADRALFPDAVSARATRHLAELTRWRDEGGAAAVLFLVQRRAAVDLRPAAAIDPRFAGALAVAEAAGVRLIARRCRVDAGALTLGPALPVHAGSGVAPP